MSMSLAFQFLSDFCPIPDFYAKIPPLYAKISTFYADVYLFGFHCARNLCVWVPVGHLWSISRDSTRAMRGRGVRAGSRWWRKLLRECAHKIILARNLLRQAKDRSQIPVLIFALQGTGKVGSADHVGLQPRDCNCDPAVDPSTYVWNGFLKFLCH